MAMARRSVRDTLAAEQTAVVGAHAAAVARAQARQAANATHRGVADLFAARADPTQACLAHALVVEELCIRGLAQLLYVTESAVSQHLSVLRRLHIVQPRRAGRFVYYQIDDAQGRQVMHIDPAYHGHSADAMFAALGDIGAA